MSLGQRLRDLRGSRTLREIADGSGVSFVSVGDYERGAKIPSRPVLGRLAHALRGNVVELEALAVRAVMDRWLKANGRSPTP